MTSSWSTWAATKRRRRLLDLLRKHGYAVWYRPTDPAWVRNVFQTTQAMSALLDSESGQRGWFDPFIERVIRREEMEAVPGQVECQPLLHGSLDVFGPCPFCGAAV